MICEKRSSVSYLDTVVAEVGDTLRLVPRIPHLRSVATARLRVNVSRCRLTVKLRGRPEAPDARRGRTLSPGGRAVQPPTPHGPLERLSGGFIDAV